MKIQYTNGQAAQEVDDYGAAVDLIEASYPDAIFTRRDGWDGEPDESTSVLVWRNEAEAGPNGHGDDGSRAIAEISL